MQFVTLTHIDRHATQINVDEICFVMCWDHASCILLMGRNALRPGRVFVKGSLQDVTRQLYGNV